MNDLIEFLQEKLGKEKVAARLIDRLAYASDAGFYRLVPKVVVRPTTESDICSIFSIAATYHVSVTFRAGGTSLSGQSISDGILVDLSKNWKKVIPDFQKSSVSVQPGVTGSIVNQILKKQSKKIGPDPSSISAAMMGGILANNSSGMCCGVKNNSYNTLKSLKVILTSGKVFQTNISNDYKRFEVEEKKLAQGLTELRNEIQNNSILKSKIESKYLIKNTVGYCLNSFLDYENPLDIFAHLMIGSEGTLGFISEAELFTLPDFPFKATAFIYFPTIETACAAIDPLKNAGAEALELMDRASLQTIENIKGVPEEIKNLPFQGAALLCEMQSGDLADLNLKIAYAENALLSLEILGKTEFTQDEETQHLYWKLRKGMFPSVGALRKKGTTVVLEDIAFPVPQLANAIKDLQVLFKKYNYSEAIIFGHAKDGNIHFVIAQDFNSEKEIERYDAFLSEVVNITVKKYNGSLKAEHGTGRNMAPFVETEWGTDAYEIMKKVKSLADPNGILNPGVIINTDPKAHLKNIKPMPIVESEVDKCIECGYCEPNCPSRNLTLTPRQRIQLRREMVVLDKKSTDFIDLQKDYQYSGLETCAVDGMCANDCPVDINTGELVKRLRKENHSEFENGVGKWVSSNFKLSENMVRLALGAGVLANKMAGKNTLLNITNGIRKAVPEFPIWINGTVTPKKITNSPSNPDAIYFQTCISRMMGGYEGQISLPEAMIQVSEKLGVKLLLHPNIQGHCCSQAFASKGLESASQFMANKTIKSLYEWSKEGKLPIVVDTSSCTQTLQHLEPHLNEENKRKYLKLSFLDTVDFIHDVLMPKMGKITPLPEIAIHPVCSTYKSGTLKKLKGIAEKLAAKVNIPLYAGCCGMAGDRGFHFPELTSSAAKLESENLSSTCSGYYSTSRTCELSLSKETGKKYESIIYAVREVLDRS